MARLNSSANSLTRIIATECADEASYMNGKEIGLKHIKGLDNVLVKPFLLSFYILKIYFGEFLL